MSHSRQSSEKAADRHDSFFSTHDSRPRSRTPSPTRTFSRRSNSPAAENRPRSGSPAYSDGFESEPEYEQHSRLAERKRAKRNVAGPGKFQQQQQQQRHSQRSHQGAQRLSPRQLDQATRRIMSAKNKKVAELRNELEFALKEVSELRAENRLLQKQNRINERALNKFDSADSQLSQTISRHQEEVRTLKEQLRRYKDRHADSSARVKELEAESAKLKKFNDRLREQAEQENLPDRDSLSRKVSQLEDEVSEKERRVQELERHVENLQKNHRHEIAIEVHRHKDTQRRVKELEEQLQEASTSLKEKEKILDIQNIYAQRAVRPPHHLGNNSGSVQNLRFNSASRSDHSTPRDKIRAYEEKRRQQMEEKRKKKKEVIAEEHQHQQEQQEQQQEQPSNEEAAEDSDSDARFEEDRRRRQREEEEEEEERQRQMRRRQEDEDAMRERQRIKQQQEEEAEKHRQEDEERRRRREREEEEESRQRREREREDKEERERKRLEEEEASRQREIEFEELKKREEEEREKKAALLARLKQMDLPDESTDDPAGKQGEQQATRQRKQYEFTSSVENLHQGKPAQTESGSRAKKPPPAAAASGGRSPPEHLSEGGSQSSDAERRAAQKAREAKMMADLFGSESPPQSADNEQQQQQQRQGGSGGRSRRAGNDLDDLLSGSPSYQPTGFGDSATKRKDSTASPAGSAKLLPRRPSNTRPALGASEDVDDIEEMVL